jgi:hypothetical protein
MSEDTTGTPQVLLAYTAVAGPPSAMITSPANNQT